MVDLSISLCNIHNQRISHIYIYQSTSMIIFHQVMFFFLVIVQQPPVRQAGRKNGKGRFAWSDGSMYEAAFNRWAVDGKIIV